MLKTGSEHLERPTVGRTVYIGGERVADMTAPAASEAGACTVAALYDMKHAADNVETCSY